MVKMKKTNLKKFKTILFYLIIFLVMEIPTGFLKAKIFLAFAPDNSLTMRFHALPRLDSTICTDGVSPILIDIALVDSNLEPVPYALIKVYMNNFTGKITPKYPITDKDGRVTISILPDSHQVKNSIQTGSSYTDSIQPNYGFSDTIQTSNGYTDYMPTNNGYPDFVQISSSYLGSIQIIDNGYSCSIQDSNDYTDHIQTKNVYSDSIQNSDSYPDSSKLIDIDASVRLEAKKSKGVRCNFKLSPPPVLLIHGFQDTSESMIPLKHYLDNKGFRVYAIDYDTNSDIESMAEALGSFINNIKSDLFEINVFTDKVDIVAHSLGGLVSRYYSTNEFYSEEQNIRKIIFINVPHHGTPWAEAGAALLDSPFLKELYPTANLFTSSFPSSINKGLNHKIQVANIALENDEVVPLPSSRLDAWGIETKIYRIGSSPLSLESIISNQAGGSSRHRQILFFVPVFDNILQYLTYNQSYPRKRR
jgi:pimeloyl-ACP methyl ester carboxylesterase